MASKEPAQDTRKPRIRVKPEAAKPASGQKAQPRKRPAAPRLKPLYSDWAMI